MSDMPSPRFTTLGDACSVCSERIKPGDFLVKIQSMGYTGYMNTEICVKCLFKYKKDEMKAALEKDS